MTTWSTTTSPPFSKMANGLMILLHLHAWLLLRINASLLNLGIKSINMQQVIGWLYSLGWMNKRVVGVRDRREEGLKLLLIRVLLIILLFCNLNLLGGSLTNKMHSKLNQRFQRPVFSNWETWWTNRFQESNWKP